MKRELAKAVKIEFAKFMTANLPQFNEDRSAIAPPGCMVYKNSISPDLSAFLLLLISPRQDRFNVECAWSTDGTFPTYAVLSRPKDFPDVGLNKDLPIDGRFRFRLASLWVARGDIWWDFDDYKKPVQAADGPFDDILSRSTVTTEEANKRAKELVSDAASKITQYAIPYFASLSGRE